MNIYFYRVAELQEIPPYSVRQRKVIRCVFLMYGWGSQVGWSLWEGIYLVPEGGLRPSSPSDALPKLKNYAQTHPLFIGSVSGLVWRSKALPDIWRFMSPFTTEVRRSPFDTLRFALGDVS